MKFSAWVSASGCDHTFIAGVVMSDDQRKMNPDSSLLKVFEAGSWNDANRQYHEFKGWKPYKPMLDENGNEYPEDNAPFSAMQS